MTWRLMSERWVSVVANGLRALRPWALGLLLGALGPAFAADIYGYVDDKGVAHFASEKIDTRYLLFFKGGQDFDTADGVAPIGRPGLARNVDPTSGKVSPASQTLLALFEASPSYKVAKSALRDAAKVHAIDYELLQAVVATESGFNAQAVSPKGALGLMQLMPATAEQYGVRADPKRTQEAKLFDPRINIAAGSRYLSYLLKMFKGDFELAVAAYNAGEGAVQRAGNKIPNYHETQNYVKTVLQLYAYLKPAATATATSPITPTGRGDRAPERVKMELSVPQGGALGRGNMPGAMLPDRMPLASSPPDPYSTPTTTAPAASVE